MHFKISTFTFPMYNLWILIALIVAGLFVYKNLRDNRIPRKIVILTLFLSLVSIVVGGKLFAFFTNERAVDFKTSTISSYGSVIGLILFLILFTKIYKWNSNTIFTTYLLTAPLMYSVSKIGCFFVGCCLGIPYDGIFRVEYNNVRTNSRAFPIQLLETIVFAVIFIVCNKLYKNGCFDKIKNYFEEKKIEKNKNKK